MSQQKNSLQLINMDHQRAHKTANYNQKKLHKERHEKAVRNGFNEEQNNLLQHIEQMSPHQMYKFMSNKFEKIIQTNEKLLPKIYTAVSKRMKKFEPEMLEEQKAKFTKFVSKHTGYKVSQQDINEVFDLKKTTFQPKKMTNNEQISYLNLRGKLNNQIWMLKVMKLQPKQQFSNTYQKYYLQGIKADVIHDLDLKRFKKDCVEVLQQFLTELAKVEKAINEE